jgi:uncharacterized protein YdcH (DUF465 family)
MAKRANHAIIRAGSLRATKKNPFGPGSVTELFNMKTKNFLATLVVLFSAIAVTALAVSIDKTAASLNADAQKPGGPELVMKSISASTHIPVATLEKEKATTNFSYGDLYAAHAIAKASGKTFADIAALKASGKKWDKIAEENNVSLDGKKKVAKTTAQPTATPEEVRSLRQQQADRFSQRTEVTNVRKAPSPTPTPKP